MFGKSKWQLLHDGAPAHKDKRTHEFLAQNKVQVVERWPGNSPDLNPIENLWSWLARRLGKLPITTHGELREALQREWEHVPRELLVTLSQSMERRLQRVLERDGAYTEY